MGPFTELQIPRNSKSVIRWLGKVVSVPNAVVCLLKDVGAPDGLRLRNRSRNGVAGKLQKPKASHTESLARTGTISWAYYPLVWGYALDKLGNHTHAVFLYDKAKATDPRYIPALTEKGDFLDKIGNYKLAIIYYDKALAIDPKNIDAIKGKQHVLATLNQPE
ncbi:MAG: tetratricopeptide repeat protein [Nitrososphaeraceae archaeon]